MSAKASGYAKALIQCPNGELITAREKLVLMCLADSHQDKAKRFTYPSVDTIAAEALCDRRTCYRYLASLERKGILLRLRPDNQGRGLGVFYFFPALDVIPEGWQPATLSDPPLLLQKDGRRMAEGWQKGDNPAPRPIERAQEQEPQPEQKLKTTPPTPLAGEGEVGPPQERAHAGQTKNRPTRVAPAAHDSSSHQRTLPLGQNPRGVAPLPAQAKAGTARIGSVEAAVDQVAHALGVANARKRKLLRKVIELECDKGGEPPTIALAMIAAWNLQAKKSAMLRCKFGMTKFFGEGLWKDQNRWHWDEELLRRQSEARTGSYA